jgi:hypothetical protein
MQAGKGVNPLMSTVMYPLTVTSDIPGAILAETVGIRP